MTHWTELTKQHLSEVPSGAAGVFQLSRDGQSIHYVGRSDTDLHSEIARFLGRGYKYFQWQKLPWDKEAYEMQCRLFHHAGGIKRLDNDEHPFPPEGRSWVCRVGNQPPAICDL